MVGGEGGGGGEMLRPVAGQNLTHKNNIKVLVAGAHAGCDMKLW